MTVRTADLKDLNWLLERDCHIPAKIMKERVLQGDVLLMELDTQKIGWLRYNLFWDSIPFVNMLFLLPEFRGKGYGTQLMLAWEQIMRSQGFGQVMTSTQANECAQHFYRKLGYLDVGGFCLPNEPLELILVKKLPREF